MSNHKLKRTTNQFNNLTQRKNLASVPKKMREEQTKETNKRLVDNFWESILSSFDISDPTIQQHLDQIRQKYMTNLLNFNEQTLAPEYYTKYNQLIRKKKDNIDNEHNNHELETPEDLIIDDMDIPNRVLLTKKDNE